jgi:hypothetical protein
MFGEGGLGGSLALPRISGCDHVIRFADLGITG